MRPQKFNHIASQLERRILDGDLPPGSQLPSQSQLCEDWSVSRSCAQKALDLLHSRGLVEKRPGKGVYVKGPGPHDSNSDGRFKNVALIFHESFRFVEDPSDNFGLEMLWGVEEELRTLGANCIIRKEDRGTASLLPALESIGADAFIVDREFKDEQMSSLKVLGRPVAALGRLSSLPFVSSSLPNHADCFLKVLLRLADEGRKCVGVLYSGASYYAPEMEWAVERASALRRGTRFVKADVRCKISGGNGGLAMALEGLLDGGACADTIIFESDWSAFKGMGILRDRGLSVPGDVGVIGCYGLELGRQSEPSMSSLWLDPGEIGRRAVRLLADSALRGRAPSVEKVPFEFIERDSFRWALEKGDASGPAALNNNKRRHR